MKYSKILLCFGALWASSAFPAPAPCDTLRVAFLTDIHVTPGNVQDSLFRVAVDEINASPCDIVIFGGDLTNLGSDAELEYVHGLISRLEKPWHAVPGNHETTWSESACTTFARIFGHDGRTAFRAGDYLFLGYASGPFMKMAMGAVRTEDLAAKELGLKTARYFYAASLGELREAAAKIGFPCVVKPLMSSSGKGQSLVKGPDELERAWHYGCEGSRGDIRELIIEEFIRFDSEITLLTVTQQNGPTLFCPPIGHVQKGGDYRESFQPAPISPEHLAEAQAMAAKVTQALTGAGLWGVEFFLSHDKGVYFSELSPRPHDTGMVTLAGTQNLNEFELHCRAVLGLPIPRITLEHTGASAVILSPIASREQPRYRGEEEVCREENTDLRIFGKPSTKLNRRMGVVVGYEPHGSSLEALRERVCAAAAKVKVTE